MSSIISQESIIAFFQQNKSTSNNESCLDWFEKNFQIPTIDDPQIQIDIENMRNNLSEPGIISDIPIIDNACGEITKRLF